MNKLQTLCTMAPWDVLSNNTKIKARYETAPRLSVAGRLQKMWNLYLFYLILLKCHFTAFQNKSVSCFTCGFLLKFENKRHIF